MEALWRQVARCAADLAPDERSAVRLTDLALARAAAEALRLAPVAVSQQRPQDDLCRQAVEALALSPVRATQMVSGGWSDLVHAAAGVQDLLGDPETFERWSAASQAADPGRKSRGAYSTPSALADRLVAGTLAPLVTSADELTICDPSAGHGALLLSAYRFLRAARPDAPAAALLASLHGVELDAQARELCCLLLWLSAADPSVQLADVTRRVIHGNALVSYWSQDDAMLQWRWREYVAEVAQGQVSDAADVSQQHLAAQVASHATDWSAAFPEIFAAGGFDAIISNPPWESLRHRADDPGEALARELTRVWLSTTHSNLAGSGDRPLFQLQGRGDANLYKGFVELYPHLMRRGGRLGALIPGAFASDLGMREARAAYLDHMCLEQWTSFENLKSYFPIDGRYKFGVLFAVKEPAGTRATHFRFLARDAADVAARDDHVILRRADLSLIGGPHMAFPEVVEQQELGALLTAFEAGVPFFSRAAAFGEIRYRREVDLTLDRRAGRFKHLTDCEAAGFAPGADGVWRRGSEELVPLLEGRMVGQFDFFQKSWRGGSGRSALWQPNGSHGLNECQPQFLIAPAQRAAYRLAICDVTSATNTRTMLATWVPPGWSCGNTAAVLEVSGLREAMALLAVLNSMTFDWIIRRVVAGLHLNRFYLEATPLPKVDAHDLRSLATYAMARTAASPCYASLPAGGRQLMTEVGEPSPGIGEQARVEAIVATGFGLSAQDLEFMLKDDSDDRRGHWRYYAAQPEARETAERAVLTLADWAERAQAGQPRAAM